MRTGFLTPRAAPSRSPGLRLRKGDQLENPCCDPLGGLELDVVAYAVEDLGGRAGNRPRDLLSRGGRHDVALGAGHYADDAANAGEKRERIDRLGGEHAPIP